MYSPGHCVVCHFDGCHLAPPGSKSANKVTFSRLVTLCAAARNSSYVDDEGFEYVLDRKKDMILTGGLNVYAADIEEVLAQHPAAQECTVIAVPSERWGESPLALVIMKPEAPETDAEIREWLNARVGKAQRVCAVVFRESFPRGSLDKILKRELRDEYKNLDYGNAAA